MQMQSSVFFPMSSTGSDEADGMGARVTENLPEGGQDSIKGKAGFNQ